MYHGHGYMYTSYNMSSSVCIIATDMYHSHGQFSLIIMVPPNITNQHAEATHPIIPMILGCLDHVYHLTALSDSQLIHKRERLQLRNFTDLNLKSQTQQQHYSESTKKQLQDYDIEQNDMQGLE
jgi:hypothetical protein